MTTKKFQLIIWIVTLIIVVGSCIIRFAPFSSGRSEESEYDFSKYSVETVKVDADAADLYIEYGDEFKVNTNYQKNVEPKVTLEDECLTIEQKYTVNVRNMKDCYIKITLPKGTMIDTADITASAGDIDIDGVNFDTLKIDADAGDIDINEVTANDFVIEADAGDIEPYAHLGIMASDGMGTRKNDANAKFYLEKYLQERGNDELTPAVDPCYYYPRRWRVPLLVILTCIYAAFLFFVSTIPTDGSMAFSS